MDRIHPLREIYDKIDNGTPDEKLRNIVDFPRIIELEITNHCNFQCLMCPTGVKSAKRERGYMSQELFSKLIGEIKEKQCALKFVGQGEPTLHPQFLDFLTMAKRNNIICHLTTNGSMFSSEFIEKILATGIDSIKFSFQGVTAEDYYRLRRKKDFDVLLDRIAMLYQKRGEAEKPFITIGTSILTETKEQVDLFKKRCEQICDNVEIGVTTLQYTDPSIAPDEQTRKLFESIKDEQKKYLRRYKCCHQVFDVITIHWNGNVSACCSDIDDEMVLGNLAETTLLECWRSDKEKRYREILAAAGYDKLLHCKDCYDVYGWTYKG